MTEPASGAVGAPRDPNTSGIQDVAIIFLTKIGLVVLGLLIQAILAWVLLPEGRGSYAVCILFGTTLGLLFTPGAQQGVQYYVMTGESSVSQGVATALVICAASIGLMIVLAIPLIYSDITFFQKADTHSFQLSLILIPLTAFSIAVEHIIAGLRQFARLAGFLLIRVFIQTIALLVLVAYLDFGVDGAIIAFAAGHISTILICLWYLRGHYNLGMEFPTRNNLVRAVLYGIKFHGARIGEKVEMHMGVLVLGFIASSAEIGLFATTSELMFGFVMISNAVGNALLPRIAGKNKPDLVALCLRLVCIVTVVVIVLALSAGTPLIPFLLSKSFESAIPMFWIIAPGIVAFASGDILLAHFKAINRPDICSWSVVSGMCVNIAFALTFYSLLGIEAAAIALTVGMFSRFLFLAIVFAQMKGEDDAPIWPPRKSDFDFLWSKGLSLLKEISGEWRQSKDFNQN